MVMRGVAMVFSAQGSVGPLLEMDVLRAPGAFAESMKECDAVVRRRLGWSPLEELENWRSVSPVRLHGRFLPIFASLQISLAREFLDSGESIDAVAGLCAGEAAAFHVAGAYALADALEVACAQSDVATVRGPCGGLALVRLAEGSRGRAIELIDELDLHVAAELSPTALVLGGEEIELKRCVEALSTDCLAFTPIEAGIACRLPASDDLEQSFRRALGPLRSHLTNVDLYSAVTGNRLDTVPTNPVHWWNAVSGTGRFETMIRKLVQAGFRRFIEISPLPTLKPFIEETCRAEGTNAYVIGVGCANRAPGGRDPSVASPARRTPP